MLSLWEASIVKGPVNHLVESSILVNQLVGAVLTPTLTGQPTFSMSRVARIGNRVDKVKVENLLGNFLQMLKLKPKLA